MQAQASRPRACIVIMLLLPKELAADVWLSNVRDGKSDWQREFQPIF